MIGTVFTKLTVVGEITASKMQCRCECGNEVVVPLWQLKNGNNKSCGCMMRSTRSNIGRLRKTHGASNGRVTGYKNRAYGIWQAMKDRCTNKNRGDYHRYGGRGITVCSAWANSFEQFLADMGEPPEKMTLERKDSDKGYELDNCVWATRLQQGRNTANVKQVTLCGETKPLWQWLEEKEIKRGTYYHRLYAGWTQEEAILGKNK